MLGSKRLLQTARFSAGWSAAGLCLPPWLQLTRASRAYALNGTGVLVQREVNEAVFDGAGGDPGGLQCYGQVTNYNPNPRFVGASPGPAATNLPIGAIWSNGSGLTFTIVAVDKYQGFDSITVRCAGTFTAASRQTGYTASNIPAVSGDSITTSAYYQLMAGSLPSGGINIIISESVGSTLVRNTLKNLSITGDFSRLGFTKTIIDASITQASCFHAVYGAVGEVVDFTFRMAVPMQTKTIFPAPIILPPEGIAAQSTRMPDVIRLTDGAFQQLLGDGSQGTIIAEITSNSVVSGFVPIPIQLTTAGNNTNRLSIGVYPTNFRLENIVNTVTADISYINTSVRSGVKYKILLSWDKDSLVAAAAGQTISIPRTQIFSPNMLIFGSSATYNNVTWLNGTISNIRVLPVFCNQNTALSIVS